MLTDIYPRSHTGLLLVDPYNDFLAPNGKLWPRAKEVAEEVDLLKRLRSRSSSASQRSDILTKQVYAADDC